MYISENITSEVFFKKNSNLQEIRHDWTRDEVINLYSLPFLDLIFKAQIIHRNNFPANRVQCSTLLSIKTGSCPEDCKYCPQSAHYKTGLEKESLMDKENILEYAKKAKEAGASRFCMGAAWRNLSNRNMEKICDIINSVSELGMETCATFGMITTDQAKSLKEAGLDYYNHNLDTSEEFYDKIITTRTYQDRLETLANVRMAGINVCCGGIIGMGEAAEDRAGLLVQLANMERHPESVPINSLVKVAGTPLENVADTDIFDFIKTIAIARIMMPKSYVRLSAGREQMTEEAQALCFVAGANSIFYGDKLLTTGNPKAFDDDSLFQKLGIEKI